MKAPGSISIFFPVYNDAPTIEALVETAREVATELTDDWEIILVNDCSEDDSAEVIDRLAAADPRVRAIHHEKNRGYGGALKSGFAAATKEWIFYTDGDGQYDVGELRCLAAAAGGVDVVNGYKIERADRTYRKVLGFLYHSIVKTMFGLRVRDVDCDFRLIRSDVINAIRLESNSGVICTEMMTKLHGLRARIREVPVHHYSRVAGRSQFFRPGRIARLLLGLGVQWWRLILCEGKRRVRISQRERAAWTEVIHCDGVERGEDERRA